MLDINDVLFLFQCFQNPPVGPNVFIARRKCPFRITTLSEVI